MYLVDTNVISELRKTNPNRGVLVWLDGVFEPDLFISVMTFGEMWKGAARLARNDPRQAAVVDAFVRRTATVYRDRILEVSYDVAEVWGRLMAVRPLPAVDGLLAATCLVRELTLVSRNEADFVGIDGLSVLNPFVG